MKFIAIAFALVLIASGAFAQTPSNVNLNQPVSTSGAAPSSPSEQQQGAVYRLGPGDQLHVIVYGETDLTGDYTVSPVGTIAFPLIGEVAANGLTPDQMSQAIANRLEQGYM